MQPSLSYLPVRPLVFGQVAAGWHPVQVAVLVTSALWYRPYPTALGILRSVKTRCVPLLAAPLGGYLCGISGLSCPCVHNTVTNSKNTTQIGIQIIIPCLNIRHRYCEISLKHIQSQAGLSYYGEECAVYCSLWFGTDILLYG